MYSGKKNYIHLILIITLNGTMEDYIDKKYCKNILININLFSP